MSSLFHQGQEALKFYIKTGKEKKAISELITSNGGTVIKTRAADVICLSHPENPETPKGFYSTEYIKDCIKEKCILDKDKYILAPLLDSSNQQKKDKVAFDTEDHQILANAISVSSSSATGNALYIELEKAYPHHSWQSWRDYAIKKYLPNIKHLQSCNKDQDVRNDQDVHNDQDMHNDQENSSVENQDTSNVRKDSKCENVDLKAEKDHNTKRPKIMSISESDQLHINQYLIDFNVLCEEFDCWERQDILRALFMSSGSVKIAKGILCVGFNLSDLDKVTQDLIYTRDQDKMILDGNGIIYKELLNTKGERSVAERKEFLSQKPNCGVAFESLAGF